MMDKIACITGASSGMGYESAKQLAALGYDLVLTARRKDKLIELKEEIVHTYHSKVYILPLDLLGETAVYQLVYFINANNLKLDLLLNNAGFGDYGAFKDADMTKLENMINLNVVVLTKLTHALIPLMNPKSQICNVGSLASFMPGPYMSVYYASKSYVLNLSLALQEELKPLKIKVSTFVPGPVATEFNTVAKAHTGKSKKPPTSMKMLGSQPVEEAVRIMLDGLEKNKTIIFSKSSHAFLVFLIGFVPHRSIGRIMAIIQKARFEKR